MDFILILFFVILFALILPKPKASVMSTSQKDRKCPPHVWFWEDIMDEKGLKLGERICCKFCGPLKPNGGDSRYED